MLFATGEMELEIQQPVLWLHCWRTVDSGLCRYYGKGAGLSDEGLQHKIEVINAAREKYQFDSKETFRILCSVGGLDIAVYVVCIGEQFMVFLLC